MAIPPIFTTTLGQVVSSAMSALSLGEYVIAFPAVRPEAERSNGVVQNINATRRHAAQVRLGDDGELHGYIAGQPFPVLDPADREFGNYEMLAQGMYRPRPKANRWGQDEVLQKEFFHILPLFDLKNTMSLKHRHARDADRWIPACAGMRGRNGLQNRVVCNSLLMPFCPLSLRERAMGRKRLDRRDFKPTPSRPERQKTE